MKVNSSKCHLITSKLSCMSLKIGDINIENSTCEKLLGIKTDTKLTFNEHLDGIIKVVKLALYLGFSLPKELKKRHFLMNSFFASQFITALLSQFITALLSQFITALLSGCVRAEPFITK